MRSRYFVLACATGGNLVLATLAGVGCGSSSTPAATGASTAHTTSSGALQGASSSSSGSVTTASGNPTASSSSGTSSTGGNTSTGGSSPATTSSSSSGSATGGSSSGPQLGASCTKDSDCGGGGLTCTLPTANDPFFGGGPAGGYCTQSCTADGGTCGANGTCLSDGTNGRCLLKCMQGPALVHLNDVISNTAKCYARTDVACVELNAGGSVCIPTCNADSQCPTGLHCDPVSTTCVQTATTGLAQGAQCDPNADGGGGCAGLCLTFEGADGGAGPSVCSESCELGDSASTASKPASWVACGGPTGGLCAFANTGAGAGDQGFCAGACNTQDACDNADGFWCFAESGLTGLTGIPNGWCFGGAPCPNGDSDCKNAGGTCNNTKYGPQCLSAQFPLGSAAPPDGGTDAGPG